LETLGKVLVLGSGPIKIAEAGEFDYSGSQCLKALREEGIRSILVNPNVATIQTDPAMADRVYLLPVTPEYVERVVEEERPDGIMLGFGGQTALNCGVALADRGVLERYGVRVLGTPIEGIRATEDRALFKQLMLSHGLPVPRSEAVTSLEEGFKVVEHLGFPVMLRVAFALGGRGSGVAHSMEEFRRLLVRGLSLSPAHQVLVEEYLGDWKQIEYEVIRDRWGNSVTPCNMENILGMRVHTGDNIVIAPTQTLTNREYQMLRDASIRIAEACGVVGECNVQYALNTRDERFYVIEVNARLSRSSALASKATGYPLAYVAAKLALGYSLLEVINMVTKVTRAFFEPALDYVVVKMPRWDVGKFERASRRIGTQMKSVGEAMAIGRSFEEALQKACRMVETGWNGLVDDHMCEEPPAKILTRLEHPTVEIIHDVARALEVGIPEDEISRLTGIDPWFVRKIRNITEFKKAVLDGRLGLNEETLGEAKRLGFSDKQLARWFRVSPEDIRRMRGRIKPVTKAIDTLAGEWPAATNYLYMTYGGTGEDAPPTGRRKVIVLGAGAYRIGSSVEFDWCTVNMARALKALGIEEVIVVNCNPETVSTDYDLVDRLYFEELTLERVLDIWEREGGLGVVACVGGQTANNLIPKLARYGVPILGTDPASVDRAEDRSKFSRLLDELGIQQPPWTYAETPREALEFGRRVGYPLLVRPSYVLGGQAMRVVWSPGQLTRFLRHAALVSPEYPVVLSKYLVGAYEAEVDAVGGGGRVFVGAVLEHLERAGVHSGDATMVIPPIRLPEHVVKTMEEYSVMIARELCIKGPFNVQFLVKGGQVLVIECNLRASRSMPFTSKAMGIDLMRVAAKAILGMEIEERRWKPPPRYAVKAPQFSFTQVEGADPVLGVEMRSTGEAACMGTEFYDAYVKALQATGMRLPRPGDGVLFSAGGGEKARLLPVARALSEMGYKIYATEHTASYFAENGLRDVNILFKISEPRRPNIGEYLERGLVKLVINIPSTFTAEKMALMLEDEYQIRRWAVDLGIPVVTEPEVAAAIVEGLRWLRVSRPTVQPLERMAG
jgi:carbamoyl-phosphate synthase large subunit